MARSSKKKHVHNNRTGMVSLGSIVIDAPPEEVYKKLAHARDWEKWAQVVRLIHTAQTRELQSGNTICYTSKLVPGFIDGTIADAEPAKVLNWGDSAIFGLVRGKTRWQLSQYKARGRGMWLSKILCSKTLVTLDQEVTGLLSFVVSESALDSHANQWLAELKAACEVK